MADKKNFILNFFKYRIDPDSAQYQESLEIIYDLLQMYFKKRINKEEDINDLVQDSLLGIHKSEKKQVEIVSKDINEFLEFLSESISFFPENQMMSDLESLLSDVEKNIFIKSKIEGLSNIEIANDLNMSLEAIKSHSYRIRKKVQRYFS